MTRVLFLAIVGSTFIALEFDAAQAHASTINYALTTSSQFGVVDLQTGAFTQTGILTGISGPLSGDIAKRPGGPLYGMDSSSNLVLINPATATDTTVGNSGNGIFGLGFRGDGVLFGISFQNLYKINTATGAATLVGQMGTFANSGFAEARFDNSGNLFLVEQNGASTSSLYSVNASTGLASLIGSTGFTLPSIDYENGTLYGFTTNSKIISLNTATGAGTFLVNESGTTGEIIATTVPEPSTMALLGIGAAGIVGCGRRRQKLAAK